MCGLQGVCDAVNLRHPARRQPSQTDLITRGSFRRLACERPSATIHWRTVSLLTR